MRLANNLLAGLANSVVSALVGLAVVPLYIKYLGIEAYGLIGFFATTQAILQLLDMGLAPTMNREVARHSALGDLKQAGLLLHSLAVVYWSMAGIIALFIVALAPLIAGYWLQSTQLAPQSISHAVMLMGLVAACRWPIGLYQGALMGAQRLTVASGVNITMVTLGSLGAVAVLALVSPTIEAFFIWQAGVGLAYAVIMRWAAWRVIGRLPDIRFDVVALKKIGRFSAGMGGITIMAIILTQLDKALLSKMLSLEDFGRYALAGIVANSLYLIISPTFNVIYPHLSMLVATGEKEKLLDFYRSGTRFLACLLFPFVIAFAISSEYLVSLWTGDKLLATSVAPIIQLLMSGTALNGIMNFPYALQLASGMTRIPFIITICLAIILIPMTIYLTRLYGATGGGLSWLLLNSLYLVFGTWFMHRYLLKGIALAWLIHDVGVPFCVSMIIIVGGWQLAHTNGNDFINSLLSFVLAMLAFSFCVKALLGQKVNWLWKMR